MHKHNPCLVGLTLRFTIEYLVWVLLRMQTNETNGNKELLLILFEGVTMMVFLFFFTSSPLNINLNGVKF